MFGTSASAAETIAFIALSGVMATAVVSLLVGILNTYSTSKERKWKKDQWVLDKKKEAYFMCLTYLYESRIMTHESVTGGHLYIRDEHFDDRIASLRYVVPWLTIAASYSPGIARLELEKVRNELHGLIQEAQTTDPAEVHLFSYTTGAQFHTLARADHGLSECVEKAMRVVVECAKTELLKV